MIAPMTSLTFLVVIAAQQPLSVMKQLLLDLIALR
jgi:hypothetical protein